MNFFAVSVEWSDTEDSHLLTFWARAEHMGEAIHKILKSAEDYDIPNPIIVAADFDDFDELPEVAESYDNGETFVHNAIHTFPTELTYRLPYGVIESFTAGREGYTTEDLTVGYAIDAPDEDDERDPENEDDDEDDLIELRAVVEEENLLTNFLILVDSLPDIDVFWVKFQNDWETADCDDDRPEEIYINPNLKSRQAIAEFIERNRRDILQNGFVTITAYSSEGEINLSITDHKMIEVLTYDEDTVAQMAELLESCDVYQQYELVGVDHEFHHWHYRHPESRDRRDLIALLKKQGFQFWDHS